MSSVCGGNHHRKDAVWKKSEVWEHFKTIGVNGECLDCYCGAPFTSDKSTKEWRFDL